MCVLPLNVFLLSGLWQIVSKLTDVYRDEIRLLNWYTVRDITSLNFFVGSVTWSLQPLKSCG